MPGSWTTSVPEPVAGAKLTAAGWGKAVADAITALQGSWLGAFANATARDAAVTSPADGMACYLQDVDQFSAQVNGAWVNQVVGNSTWTDLAAATASLRTLGTGAQQAAAGNHTHVGSATLNTQTFTASGTWTSGASTSYALVLLVAGGGSNNANYGGGGGGQVKKEYVAVTSSTAYTVTIGAGGSGGGNGGTSSFGGLLSCNGGYASPNIPTSYGGGSGAGVAVGRGTGAGGCGGGGGGAGGPGGGGLITDGYGGAGGAGLYGYGGGGGGRGGNDYGAASAGGATSAVSAAANTGGGASGASSSLNGGSGICIVQWWS